MYLTHGKLLLNGNSYYYYKSILWQKTLPIQLSLENIKAFHCDAFSFPTS